MPELRVDTLSLVRPLPWAQAVPGLHFTPEHWGPGVFRIKALDGAHLLIRRHAAPELSFWLPNKQLPEIGSRFGFFLHADSRYVDRIRAAGLVVRVIRNKSPTRQVRSAQAYRQAAMLCVHDLARQDVSLREIATILLDPASKDWRSSSQRSDLRRLLMTGDQLAAGNYRNLLRRSQEKADR